MSRPPGIVRDGPKPRILVVEDQAALATTMDDLLTLKGFETTLARTLAGAQKCLERDDFELVVLDLNLPDGSGLDLIELLPKPPQGPTMVVLTADTSIETTVAAVRRGAYDYLPKPFEPEALFHRLRNAIGHHRALSAEALRDRMANLQQQTSSIVRLSSRPMSELYSKIEKVADHDEMPVLVSGETGVGKEHVCRLIHDASPRARQPFVAINCATLERNLLLSELFGHERGAFTGAEERRRGLFELASHGTLLLDEVAEMPPDVQAAFLRVLETGRFRRLGGAAELRTDVRVVAATNMDIEEMAREGRFRKDLLYRLNGIELQVLPLRHRAEDIHTLAEHFCQRIAATRKISCHLTEDAYEALLQYRWPGNIRELRNVIERTVVLSGEGAIRAQDLQLGPRPAPVPETAAPDEAGIPSLAEAEERLIRRALASCDGNRTRAAKLLGISRSTLVRKLGTLEDV